MGCAVCSSTFFPHSQLIHALPKSILGLAQLSKILFEVMIIISLKGTGFKSHLKYSTNKIQYDTKHVPLNVIIC